MHDHRAPDIINYLWVNVDHFMVYAFRTSIHENFNKIDVDFTTSMAKKIVK